MKVSLGTLKDKGEELATFLEPRVGTKPSLSGDAIEIEDAGVRQGVRPRHVKTYIKRFLYMKGVRKNYRVFVEGGELTIQEIELGKEEEEEKKEEIKKELAEAEAEEPKPAAVKEEPKPEEQEEAPAEAESEPEKPKKAAAKKPRARKKKADSED